MDTDTALELADAIEHQVERIVELLRIRPDLLSEHAQSQAQGMLLIARVLRFGSPVSEKDLHLIRLSLAAVDAAITLACEAVSVVGPRPTVN